MRPVSLLIAALLPVCPVQAAAQTPYLECMKGIPKETKADNASVTAMLKYADRFHNYVKDCQDRFIKRGPEVTETYRDSPEYKDYEFRAWEAEQDAKREIEAINRDYNLRRTGVLP